MRARETHHLSFAFRRWVSVRSIYPTGSEQKETPADPADELAIRRPYRHATIADVAAGIARGPDIAIDIAAHTVRSALHAVNHEIAEPLLIGELVVGADIEHEHVTLATRTSIARPFAGTDDVQLLVIGRERQPVGIRHLVLAHHEIDAAAGIDAIAVGRQLAFARHEAGRLADPWIELAGRIAGAAWSVGLALVELTAIGRVGEPVAAIRVGDDVVGRVELFACKEVGERNTLTRPSSSDHLICRLLGMSLHSR